MAQDLGLSLASDDSPFAAAQHALLIDLIGVVFRKESR